MRSSSPTAAGKAISSAISDMESRRRFFRATPASIMRRPALSFEARPDHPALAHRFFDAIAAGESELVASLATADCVIWHNYDQRDKPFSEMVPKLGAFRKALAEFAYQDRRYSPLPDGALALH